MLDGSECEKRARQAEMDTGHQKPVMVSPPDINSSVDGSFAMSDLGPKLSLHFLDNTLPVHEYC